MRFPHFVFALMIAGFVCAQEARGQGDGGSEGDGLSETWESQKVVTFDFGNSLIRLFNHHQLFSFATGADSDWSVSDENQEPIEITEAVTTGTVDVAVSPFEATASAVAQWAMVTNEFQGSAELLNSVGGTATIADKYNPALVAVSWGSHTSSVELGDETSQGVIDWTPVISVGTGGGAFVSKHDQISIHDPLIVRTRNDRGELSAPIKVFEFNANFDSETSFRWNEIRRILGGIDNPQVVVDPQEGPFLDAGSRGTGSFSLSFQSELIPAAERGTISVAFEDGIVTSSVATGVFANISPDVGPLPVEATDRLPTVGGVAVIDKLLPIEEGPMVDSPQQFRLELDAGSQQVINDAAACSDGVQVTVGPAVDMVQTFTINPLQRTDPLAGADGGGNGGPAVDGEVPGPDGQPIGDACLGAIAEDADLLFGTDYVSRGDVSLFAGPNASPIDRVLRFRSTPSSPNQVAFFEAGVYDAEENANETVHRWTARFDVRSLRRKKSDDQPPIVDPPIVEPPIDVDPIDPVEPVSPTDPSFPDTGPDADLPELPDFEPPDSDIRDNAGIIGSVNPSTNNRPMIGRSQVAPVAEDLNAPRFLLAVLGLERFRNQSLPDDAQPNLFEDKVEGLLLSVVEDQDAPIAKLTLNGELVGESVIDPDLVKPDDGGWRYLELELTKIAKGVKVTVRAVNGKRQVLSTVIDSTVSDLELARLGYRLAVGATRGRPANDDALGTVVHDFDNFMTTFQNLGDVAWDGKLDGADFRRVAKALELDSTDPLFDLNFDDEINIIDLETIEDMIPNKIPGDTNFDGHVRFEDFLKLSKHYGEETGLWSRGDFDSNGEVGFTDFLALSKNYEIAGEAADAVPEPHSAELVILALCGLCSLRGRQTVEV